MPIKVDVKVDGLIETQKTSEQMIKMFHGAPILNAMRDCTLKVEGEAKRNLVAYSSPDTGGVDTGRLRASITPVVRAYGMTEVRGIVGTNVAYAVFVEFGTRPHWPPIAALETWARRHHTSAFIVARAIARRGTMAHLYFTKAFELSKDYIERRFNRAFKEILGE